MNKDSFDDDYFIRSAKSCLKRNNLFNDTLGLEEILYKAIRFVDDYEKSERVNISIKWQYCRIYFDRFKKNINLYNSSYGDSVCFE